MYLKDVDPRHLELLLSYMYRGEINVQERELMELMATARSLQIKGLADASTDDAASASGANSSNKKRLIGAGGPSAAKNNVGGSVSPAAKMAAHKRPPDGAAGGGGGGGAPEDKRIKAEDPVGGGSPAVKAAGAAPVSDEEDYEGLEGEDYGDDYGLDDGSAVPEGGGPMIYEGDEAGEANLSAVSQKRREGSIHSFLK